MHQENDYSKINPGFQRVVEINDAISETVFSYESAGLPVYLDLDDEVLDRMGEFLEIDPQLVTESIIDSVQSVISGSPTSSNQFSRFDRATDEWLRGDTLAPPPALALLAVFSLAAERMKRSEDMGPHNYYGRLDEILNLGGHHNANESYVRVCNKLWKSLTMWLENWEGERGVPTVFEVAEDSRVPFRFVNMAISQALLRDIDRNSLQRIFAASGLEPQQNVDPEDIAGFLEDGIPSLGTGHLKKLWKDKNLKEGIAQAAAGLLRTWTGIKNGGDQQQVRVRLVAVVQKVFGQKLDLNIDVAYPDFRSPRVFKLKTADGSFVDLQFFPSGNRSLRLIDPTIIDSNSLIDGRLEFFDTDEEIEAQRLPRAVVPLRHDEITQVFVEAERVVLGAPHLVLVRETVGSGGITHQIKNQVLEVLDQCARPGWAIDTSILGLPEGWVLFKDVEFLTIPDTNNRNVALRALEPMPITTTVFTGGIQFPGAVRKWSSMHPPYVTVLNDNDTESGTLSIFQEDEESFALYFEISGPAQIFDLTPYELPDGNYRVELQINNIKRTNKLWLRSSLNPSRKPLDVIGYRLDANPLEMISAEPIKDSGGSYIRGAVFTSSITPKVLGDFKLPHEPQWGDIPASQRQNRERYASPRLKIELAPPDPTSCAVTGAHLFELPPWLGKVTASTITGVCKTCGVSRKYPARPRYSWNTDSNSAVVEVKPKLNRKPKFGGITSIPTDANPDWDVIFDSLCHLGSGAIADLDGLATQVEGTLLATDRLVRGLETLGHLDIQLHPENLRPERWSCSPSTVAINNDRLAVLLGRRNPLLIEQFAEIANRAGGQFQKLPNRNLPSTFLATFESPISNSLFEDLIDPVSKSQVSVVRDPAMQVASQLADISSFSNALPQIPLPAHRKVEVWDPELTTWIDSEDAETPGAYRFSGYAVVYGLRTEQDIKDKKIRLCTVQLLKHIVAHSNSSTLLFYRHNEEILATRLGADLPGLYGRAAALCSGLAPVEDLESRTLMYTGVPPEIAALIGKALST